VNRRSFLGLSGALATSVIGASAFGLSALGGNHPAHAGDGSTTATTLAPNTKTAAVERRDLVQTEKIDGRLGYGDTTALGGGTSGTITALPAEGQVLDRGGTLWEVDGKPGPALMFGERPMWRRLASGVEKGEDVRQLEENLVALGFATEKQLTVDDKYTSATAAAVKRWQKSRGMDQTGVVQATDVIFAPAAVRVADRKAVIGDKAGSGTVLDATGAEQIVTVKVDPTKISVAHEGDPVTIELGSGTTAKGTIRTVGTVVHSETSGGNTTNYISVTIGLDNGKIAGLDDSPVTVDFTRASAKGVLAVPVRALLALSEGGYAVQRIRNGVLQLVPVQLGAYAGGYVQITGDVAEGDKVVTA
jgi:peptidoglycan hydrolase-like protein with peptidoglycan-binding domain